MKVSSNEPPKRRSRYRAFPDQAPTSLTPSRLTLLQTIAAYTIVSVPQLAARTGLSLKQIQRHGRSLLDMGLVTVIPVPRAALVPVHHPNDANLVGGSSPNLYTITKSGLKLLHEYDLTDHVPAVRDYGPRNWLFLAHTLFITDVRIWLERNAKAVSGHNLVTWKDGNEAEISLNRAVAPKVVRPDAWFVYQLAGKVLVGLVEADRGTERANRWQDKLSAYDALFTSTRIKDITGYQQARVLVIAPTIQRRDWISRHIAGGASPNLAQRFWLTDATTLHEQGFAVPTWQQPGSALLKPLISPVTGSEA